MYFSRNLCLLCLSNDQQLSPERNLSPSILEIFGFVIPEYDSGIPNQICENCVNSLKDICNFRQMCLKSIKIYKDYVQRLKQKNESFINPSIGITDIFDEQKCEIFEDIQIVEKIKSENNFNKEIESEISGRDYYNSRTENDEQMSGKFEMVEIQVKNEICEELIKEELVEDSNLSEDEIPNMSGIHEMNVGEKEDGYISSNDSNEFDAQSTHSDTESTDGRKNINADKRPYACDVCHKTFKRSYHMNRHRQVHSNERPHTCKICQKSFKNVFHMRRHELTHSSETAHKCEICQKSFRDSFDLKQHGRFHSGDNVYKCSVCAKTFVLRKSLWSHQKVHNDKKPYPCEICPRSFNSSYSMQRHHRLIHRPV